VPAPASVDTTQPLRNGVGDALGVVVGEGVALGAAGAADADDGAPFVHATV